MFKRPDSIGRLCRWVGCDHRWRILGAVRICQCRRCRYVHAALVVVHDARKAA